MSAADVPIDASAPVARAHSARSVDLVGRMGDDDDELGGKPASRADHGRLSGWPHFRPSL
jgi:hypothetical protein